MGALRCCGGKTKMSLGDLKRQKQISANNVLNTIAAEAASCKWNIIIALFLMVILTVIGAVVIALPS